MPATRRVPQILPTPSSAQANGLLRNVPSRGDSAPLLRSDNTHNNGLQGNGYASIHHNGLPHSGSGFTESHMERPRNRVLASLSKDVWQRLAPFLRRGLLISGQALDQAGETVERVYFPNSGMVSLVMDGADGTQVEVGVIGREGIVGVLPALGGSSPFSRSVVQVAGNAFWLPAQTLRAEFKRGGALQDWLIVYLQVLTAQAAQCALCNRLHTVEERLSRWLLTVRDRIETDEIDITHEFIAHMLGARRSGVTVALGVLQQAGLIDLTRGHITITNVASLQASSCECHRLLRGQFDSLSATPKTPPVPVWS